MSKLFKAAIIVTTFSVITRAMGFVMKIALSRYLEPTTLGEYQIAMSVFSVMLTLIASGLPLIVSRRVSYLKQDNPTLANKTSSAGLCISLFLSIIFSGILFVFKDLLCELFSSKTIGNMVLSLTPALIFSSIYSILRAALWGQKRFFAISFSEFFEQLIRIVALIILFAVPIGIQSGIKATFSLSVACIFSSILVVIMYFRAGNKLVSPKGYIVPTIKQSSSITLARTVSSIVTMLISFIIPLRLTTFGFSHEQAMAEFGIVTGMALPLITIPGTFISSIAVALVPEISSQTTNIDKVTPRNSIALKNQIALAINVALVLSFMLVPAFFALGTPIAEILFHNTRAGTYISAGSFLMITMGITQISSSILNAIGLEIKTLKNYAIGTSALLCGIFILPKYIGAMSLVVSMLAMNLIAGILNLNMLKKRNLLNSNIIKTCLKLIFTVAFSGLLTLSISTLLLKTIPIFLASFVSGCLSLIFFFLLCSVLGIFKIKSFFSNKLFRKNKS